jgi:glycerol-3-phosphate acyltransferase PlsY
MGIVLALTHVDILLAIGIFIIIVAVSRYVSLGSIIATASIPVFMVIRENVFHVQITGYGTLLPFLIALAVLIVFTHRKNIQRLLAGNENKISFKKHA